MTELQPCPFCGSDGIVEEMSVAPKITMWRASCHNCACTLMLRADAISAIEAWNDRPAPQCEVQTVDVPRFMGIVRARWNFEENEFDVIEKVLSDGPCVAGLSIVGAAQAVPEPTAWIVSGGDGYERQLFETRVEAKAFATELYENGWDDVVETPLYAGPTVPSAHRGGETASPAPPEGRDRINDAYVVPASASHGPR